jgi:hypothetical protein
VNNGYYGLVGGNLWTIPLGKDAVNYVLIMADSQPYQYSTRQMQTEAEQLASSMAGNYHGQVTRGTTPFHVTGGTAFRFDIVGIEVKGTPIESQMYLLLFNGIEYYFDCQHEIADLARIEPGCRQIFDTLALSVSG